MSVKVTMNLWLVDFYQQPQTSHKKSMEHYNVKLFLVPIKHWCAIEMSRLRGSLRKRVHSTVFPHCVRAAYTHIHMKPKEKEWAVMLSSDIYLSNPISPIHTSPPRLSASHSPAGAACSCTFVKVKHAEAGERGEREKEMDGWRGVADVCWTTRSAWQKPDKAVVSQSEHRQTFIRRLHE